MCMNNYKKEERKFEPSLSSAGSGVFDMSNRNYRGNASELYRFNFNNANNNNSNINNDR